MNIAITGATGFIGRRLSERLRGEGHSVRPISLRSAPPPEAFSGCDAIVHLAGEPVAQRWTATARKRIMESRTVGTRSVVQAIAGLNPRPSVLVSASAVGYYGSRGDEILTEESAPAHDFLGEVAAVWEREALAAEALGVRVVLPRIGFVIGRGGGALGQMALPFKLGLGGRLGSGRQWISWIHLEDLCSMILFALTHENISGPVNAVAPQPVTNAEFTRELARALRRPALIPVPGFALKLLFGEMATIILEGQRVLPKALDRAGFRFEYTDLRLALQEIFGAR
jgi:uncharacterized protein (TIGR01777 family)